MEEKWGKKGPPGGLGGRVHVLWPMEARVIVLYTFSVQVESLEI